MNSGALGPSALCQIQGDHRSSVDYHLAPMRPLKSVQTVKYGEDGENEVIIATEYGEGEGDLLFIEEMLFYNQAELTWKEIDAVDMVRKDSN